MKKKESLRETNICSANTNCVPANGIVTLTEMLSYSFCYTEEEKDMMNE